MGQCNCYNVRIDRIYGNETKYGVCLGTKEVDRCNCGGDESKCDFYPEKRKTAGKMLNTAEMYIEANKNNKIYFSENADAFYSKEFGLVEAEDVTRKIQLADFPTFEHLMQSKWEEVKTMTKAEAEKKYGIRIVG